MQYKLKQVDETFWHQIADKSAYATFYHTPEWIKILCETFPRWENATIGFEFDDGNRAVVPMVRRSIFGSLPPFWYESTVPGAYGGPIFELTPTQEHYAGVNRELCKYKNILIVSNPYLDWKLIGPYKQYQTFTQIIQLESGFSKIWKNYSRGRRRAIHNAIKEGVIVTEENLFDYYQEFYKIYIDQLQKWGRKASGNYPISLYYNLARYSQDNSSIKFFAAWLNNKMIGGLIVFYHNKHVTFGFIATLTDYVIIHPEDLLLSTVVEKSCYNGYSDVDFGKSGGNEGVAKYKEYFGTEIIPLSQYQKKNIFGVLYRARRHFLNYAGFCPE